MRRTHIILFVLTCTLMSAWLAASASAQSCSAYPTVRSAPSGAGACFEQCCATHASCFSADSCSMRSEWPIGLRSTCDICNQGMRSCLGMCLVARPPGAPEACSSSMCSIPGVRCGMSDSCGNVCTGAALCAFFVRRPELAAPVARLLMF